MRLLFSIGHPGHVHHFRHVIRILESKGHEVRILAVDKEMAKYLLNAFGFKHTIVNKSGKNLFEHLKNILSSDLITWRIAREFKPDLLIGRASLFMAHIGTLQRKPYIAFSDTEHAKWMRWATYPLTDTICTPSCYNGELGPKQIRYDGYTELAYLHPRYFTPDPSVLEELGLTPDDTFIVVRFVSFEAGHDIGHHGILDKIQLVKELSVFGRVLITSEGPLPPDLEQFRIKIPPEKIHDLMFYATLYIGEGATMASECALLGTHALYVNTLRLGYTDEEETKYDLVYNFTTPDEMKNGVLAKAKQLLADPDLRAKGRQKRDRLLRDKIDVTAFMVWFIENYPASVGKMKKNPDIQESFR